MSILCGSLGSNVNWRDIHLNVLSNTFLKARHEEDGGECHRAVVI